MKVKAIVETYVKHEKRTLKAAQITQGWWRWLLKRHKDLSLRRGDNTSNTRMDAINLETISQYFKLLKGQCVGKENFTGSEIIIK